MTTNLNKNSDGAETQKLKFGQNSKTQILKLLKQP